MTQLKTPMLAIDKIEIEEGFNVRTTAPVLGTTAQVFQYEGGSPGESRHHLALDRQWARA